MKHGKDKQANPAGDSLEPLFRNIAARPKPPADVERAVYKHALESFKKLRATKKRQKRAVYWSVAASVLLAILIRPVIFPSPEATLASKTLGIVENYKGAVSVFQDNRRIQLASGDEAFPLRSGQSLFTAANAGVSIQWGSGSTIRIDQNTELKLRSSTEIELVTGQIYVDIPSIPGRSQASVELQVITRLGSINHIGTQFMVSSDASNVEVKVREGSVSVDNGKQVVVTSKGQQATLGESDPVSREAILTYGPDWQWVEKLTPVFVLEGHPLMDFLNWISRETGKELLFQSVEAESIATKTVLHGSINDEPLRALELVLQTNDLSWYEQDGKIHLFISR